ncbi:MAG: cyclase family protein [Fusicatenibacter sp.]|nr:cyclase family protein [Lachnospiraceae bacterium]MDY2938859.1 cyclase family protein [Fusicatenibacter sp.]
MQKKKKACGKSCLQGEDEIKMKLYDISKELFSTPVYPGDPVPEVERILSIENGDACNLSRLSMGSHNGTHMDAPRHFVRDGKSIEQVTLDHSIGECQIIDVEGKATREILEEELSETCERLLIRGDAEITVEGARYLAERKLLLVGVEKMTVGNEKTQKEVHQTLLGTGMVIVENLNLSEIEPGYYFLVAAPLRMKDMDGSPVRAVLIGE